MSSTVVGWLFGGWSFDGTSPVSYTAASPGDPIDACDSSHRSATDAAHAVSAADRAIIDGLRTSDDAAFTTLYKTYYLPAVKFAYRYVHTMEAAHDLAQDVFTSIWERRAEIDFDGPMLTYVLTGVRRRALKMLRHARVVERTAQEETDLRYAPPGMGTPEPSSDAAAADALLVSTFHDVLRTIPERQRAVLLLRWEQGLTNREIARVLDVGEAAVSRLLTRALEAFTQYL